MKILLTYLVYSPELRKLLEFDYVIWGASGEKQKPTGKGDILVKSPTFYDLGKLSNFTLFLRVHNIEGKKPIKLIHCLKVFILSI